MSDIEERFWSKVEIGDPDACWPWMASYSRNKSGMRYGIFRLGKMRKSHNVAWEIANGKPVIRPLVVMHTCDNSICCNPLHLVLGTQKQNIKDRNERGRSVYVRGEHQGQAKLSAGSVLSIREALNDGQSERSIARKFGVSQYCVRYTRTGWKHV